MAKFPYHVIFKMGKLTASYPIHGPVSAFFIPWLILLLAACASSYPLGIPEAEWQVMSPEQRLEAREKQAALDKPEAERRVAEERARAEEAAWRQAGSIDSRSGNLVAHTFTGIWQTCQVPNKDYVFDRFGGLWGWVLNQQEPLLCSTPDEDLRSTGVPEGHIPIANFLKLKRKSGNSGKGSGIVDSCAGECKKPIRKVAIDDIRKKRLFGQ